MITVLTGENSFEIDRALAAMVKAFSGEVEKHDGVEVTKAQLIEVLTGISLFATERLVVIRSLNDNTTVWSVLPDVIPNIADGVDLILVEPKLDKRTATYKTLQKTAEIKEFTNWGDRDVMKAENWTISEAKTLGINMDKKSVQTLVQRVGLDQWALYNALKKLAVLSEVNIDVINDVIEMNPNENVFNLLETAINGDTAKLQRTLKNLEQTEDVYRLVSLLSSQAFQLLAIASAKDGDDAVKDFGIHPFVFGKLKSLASKIGRSGVQKVIEELAKLDDDLKTTGSEPWFLVERSLIKIGKS